MTLQQLTPLNRCYTETSSLLWWLSISTLPLRVRRVSILQPEERETNNPQLNTVVHRFGTVPTEQLTPTPWQASQSASWLAPNLDNLTSPLQLRAWASNTVTLQHSIVMMYEVLYWRAPRISRTNCPFISRTQRILFIFNNENIHGSILCAAVFL